MKTQENSYSRKIILNKHVFPCIAVVTFQQALAASSTYWLTGAAAHLNDSTALFSYLLAFCCAIVLVDVVEVFGNPLRERWLRISFELFVSEFARKNANSPFQRNCQNAREKLVPILCSESENTISSTVYYLYDFLSVAMSVAFNILTFVLFLDWKFSLVYLASGMIAACFVLFSSSRIANLSSAAQDKRMLLAKILMQGWDNITIGNRMNRELWQKQSREAMHDSTKVHVQKETIMSALSGGATLASRIPVFSMLAYLLAAGYQEVTVVAALMATFSRHLQVLHYLQVVINYAMSAPSQVAQWKELRESLREKPRDKAEIEGRISWNGITLRNLYAGDGIKVGSSEEVRIATREFQPGRFEIRGQNGSGKSSLLLLIKHLVGENSFYLPAQHALVFESPMEDASTGQKTISFIEQISRDNSGVLLLDEWDANLDAQNRELIDQRLMALSKEKCVIEVRHGP